MNDRPKESDWKKYRLRIEEYRERYLEKRNAVFVSSLVDPKNTPTERFWNTLERMEREGKLLDRCLCGYSRSKMVYSMELMCRHGMLIREDLGEYSEELQTDLEPYLRG